ncbi:MAG: hypothetical protein QGI36_02180 [Candidatus Thalassarchaeaceae archaeon]|nr:hypothetical protein [Candidatus Thalassarchaeaceae archaeon]
MKRCATVLILLMLMSSLAAFTTIPYQGEGPLEGGITMDSASLNSPEIVTISNYPTSISNSFKLDIPEDEAIRNISLELAPSVVSRSDGHSFTQSSDFNQTGATSQGIDYNTSGLQVSAIDEYWSFEGTNALPSGWSSSNTNYGLINTMTCGTNGSSSRSLTLRHGTVSVTSNTIDLSSLTQGIMSLWMTEGRSGCGEDPDSSEHLYVEYKRSTGSWGQITYYNAGLGYPGYTNVNSQFNLPNDAFHSNFQFRFRLPFGSGTCCDWWFVDDVRLTKPGGQGNWTSPAFGPSASNPTYRSLPGPYGIMSIDSDTSSNAITWSVIDASNGTTLDGYDQRSGTWADLGGIDWVKHPAIRLKVGLSAQGTGSVSKINGIHIQGKYVNSFDVNPTDWSLSSCSWDGDSITGSGYAYSPTLNSRRPISKVTAAITFTGGGYLEATTDGSAWFALSNNGPTNLDDWTTQIQFRWNGQSSSFDLQKFDVELHGAGLPSSPAIDLLSSSRNEWGIVNQSIGTWGWQDVLENGNRSIDLNFQNQETVPLWIPKDSDGHFLFEVSPELTNGVSNLDIELLIDGNTISSWNYGTGFDSQTFQVEANERSNFVANVVSAQTVWGNFDVEYIRAELVLDASGGSARLGGIAIPHYPTTSVHFEPESDFVLNLNNIVSSMTATNGLVTVPIAMGWDFPAAMSVTLTELNTGLATQIELESASNLSSTLSPSWQWFELGHNLSVEEGELAALRYDLVGDNNAVTYTVWLGASPLPPDLLEGDTNAIIIPENFTTGAYTTEPGASGPGICCELHPNFKFSLNSSWEDEELLSFTLRGVMKDGLISLPWVHLFGPGPSQGVENDLLISEWRVFNDRSLVIPPSTSYLKSDSNISVEVDLQFEGLESMFGPRSNDVEVRLLENGVVNMQTTQLNQGRAIFNTRTPIATGIVDYSIELSLLSGGSDVTSISLNRSFEIDSVSPQVINQSVASHDHLEPSLAQTLTFEISDQPVLPTEVTLMLWRQWQEDSDGDGEIDADEFLPQELNLPLNLSHERGNYSFTFDDTYGIQGDFVAGYLVGSDPAGNNIVGGGNELNDSHLFIYQLMTDEAPHITREGAMWGDGPRNWLHPTTTYSLVIPFTEDNGYSDVEEVTINLAGNSAQDQLTIVWDSLGEHCSKTSPHLQLESCTIQAKEGNLTAFTNDMQINISFKLDWNLPDEGDLRREPNIEVIDRAGQGDWIALPELKWRFLADLEVVSDSIIVDVAEGHRSADGAWVVPGSNITISGRVAFSPTGDVPEEQIKVKVLLGEDSLTVRTNDGWWTATLRTATNSGPPELLTFELTELHVQARDVTDSGLAMFYITVDDTPPIPIEVVGPRVSNEIHVSSLSSLMIELKVQELEQLNVETLSINWLVTHGSNPHGDEVARGESAVTLPGHNPAGSAIPVRGTLDLQSAIPAAMLSEELSLHVWLTGQDMVGQQMVSDILFNSEGSPFASWQIQQLQAILIVEDSDLNYSNNAEIYLGDTIIVSVAVHNLGEVYGYAKLTLEEVDSEGERRIITEVPTTVGVESSKSSEGHIDWVPEKLGHYHIVVTMDGQEVATGPVVTVSEPDSESGILGDLSAKGITSEWLGILGGLFIILSLIVVISLRPGGNTEKEWFDENADVLSEVEGDSQTSDSGAEMQAYLQYMQHENYGQQQVTPEQYAQWQQYSATQQQQQMTAEQYEQWQQWAAWQQAQQQQYAQQQQGWSGYQQAQYDYGQNQ